MVFPRCTRCGCKVTVAGIACACAFATVHHQSLCGQFDRGTIYCATLEVELPHGPHHERPLSSAPYTSVLSVGSTSSTATWSDSGSFPIIR
jgi:hypothetical protein